MEKKNVLLSVKDLEVKFRVRGRILSAIRGVSLDIYEDESIAIVGESGAGKSVFTKAFAGMLDSNGFVSNGSIIFNDPELSDTVVKLNSTAWKFINSYKKQLDENSRLELGSATYRKMLELESEMREKSTLSAADKEKEEKELHALKVKRTETFNNEAIKSPALGFAFDSTKIATELTSVTNVYEEYQKSLEYGFVDPEVGIPEMLEKMNNAGLQKIIDEKQAQLDAWAAAR